MPTLHLWQGDRPYGSISKELITHHRCQDLGFSAYMDKLQQGTHSGSYVLRSKTRETIISKTRKCVLLQIASFSKKKNEKRHPNFCHLNFCQALEPLCSSAPAAALPGGEQCAMLSQCCDPNVAPTWNITSTAEFSSRSSHQLTAFFVEVVTLNYAQKSCTKILQLVHDIMDQHNSCHQLQFPEAKFHEYSKKG